MAMPGREERGGTGRFYDRGVRCEELFRAAGLGVVVQGADGRIEYANEVATEILEQSAEDLRSTTSHDPRWRMVDESGRPVEGDDHPAMVTLRTGRPIRDAVRGLYCGDDGPSRWITIHTDPLFGKEPGTAPIGVVSAFLDITARRRAELETELTLAATTDGIWSWDFRSDELFFSPRFYTMLGYDPGAFPATYASWKDLLHPEDRERAVRVWEEFRASGRDEYRSRFRLRSRDGRCRRIRSQARVVERDRAGRPLRVIGSHHDVTEQEQASEELDAIFEMSVDLMCIADFEEMRFLEVNPAFERVLGHPPEVLLSRPFTEFLHPDDEAATRSVVEEDLRSGRGVSHFVNRYRHRDGGYRWLEWSFHPVPELEITFAIARDISERREAEQALAESEHRYRALFEHLTSGVAVYTAVDDGADFILSDFNRIVERLAGVRREQLIGSRVTEVFPGVREFGLLEVLGRVWRTGEPEFVTQRRYRDDRIRAWYENHVYRLPSGDVVAVFDDVTERAEGELARSRLEEQLRQSQKMEAVGRLAGGVAHDFNNLLTGIIGNLSLARTEPAEESPIHDAVEGAYSAATRAAELTRRLLTFSRKQIISPRVVNLNRLVTRLVRMLERIIGEDVRLRLRLDSRLRNVRADPHQIEQAILNLAVNSRDAMPGGGELTISTDEIELTDDDCRADGDLAPGPHVRLCVADTGTGIPQEHLEKVLDPFFTTKPVGEGTGLGLSTVFGIVRQHAGAIEVSSVEGQGATVEILLPVVDSPEDASDERGPDDEVSGGSETILVVEDDPIVRDMVSTFLARLGYRIVSAARGSEALSEIETLSSRLDLLLTDVVMPDMNGKDLARRVEELRPDAKVIFTSGYSDDVIATHGVLDDGVEFIGKPYTPRELAAKIRSVLIGRGDAAGGAGRT